MGLFSKRLKRENLIKIDDEFKRNYAKNESLYSLLLNTIEEMEEVINKYDYKEDSRFYTYGRRDFLIEEFNSRINKEVNVGNDYILESYYDLEDIIHCDDFASGASILSKGLNPKEIEQEMMNYKNDGYICSQEKDIILNMINRLKEEILKVNDK